MKNWQIRNGQSYFMSPVFEEQMQIEQNVAVMSFYL
jgi:hypothetical protein